MQLTNVLILMGTIWPVAGTGLAIFIAILLKGWKRWLMLFAGPPLLLMPCYFYAEQIAYNGNMLFVALMGIVLLMALVYYPVLVITGIVLMVRDRESG